MINFKTVGEIGEFGLIDRIQHILPKTTHKDLIVGIGDDTAVIRIDEQRSLLITCDIQVENQHFRFGNMTPYQLGRRAMAVNLSDIAAMGGKPTFALISLGMPKSFATIDFQNLFTGMRDQLAEFSALIIGGNLSNTEKDLIIDITLLGEVNSTHFLTRSGATPGDRIFVSGDPGASAAGFWILEKFGKTYPTEFSHLVQKHRQPVPRIELGQWIAQSGFATSMIDVSDGIASDLRHICSMSQVGAEIYAGKLPRTGEIEKISSLTGKPFLEMALHHGEDYELLFTLKSGTPVALINMLAKESGIRFTEIGKIVPKESGYVLIDSQNNRVAIQPRGWDHFSPKVQSE